MTNSFMAELNNEQISRLNRVICKFPKLEEIAKKFNDRGVKWAIAAGTAVYIYCGGDDNLLDDFDIFADCQRFGNGQVFIDYRWTNSVEEHMRLINVDEIECNFETYGNSNF